MKQASCILLWIVLMTTGVNSYAQIVPTSTTEKYVEGLNVIPLPLHIHQGEGNFTLNASTVLIYPAERELEEIVKLCSAKILRSGGIALKPAEKKGASNYIVLAYDQQLSHDEAYQLIISSKSITLNFKTTRGAFYGLQTFLQLLPPEIESDQTIKNVHWSIPCVSIKDEPRFSWRGFHLDVSRHFMSVDFIKKQLDVLALYKINKFHWHLTDDQGWRIEIKKYPKLTDIGAKRIEGDGSIHEGFYTQAQIREVVAYAKARCIDVIPEIEMPGHALACLAAYPELSCTGGPFVPRNIWGVENEVFCAGKEETFHFLEDVMQEIIPLFPFQYIHIGGDECPKDRWNACPKCKERMAREHLKDSHELQSYFIQRMEKIVQSKGKKMIGWDEILEGGLSPSANVMSWRGEAGGIAAANMGHDVIMSPSNYMYINYYQGDRKIEPIANDFDIPCERLYNYEPIPTHIQQDKQKHILGAQANLWTEYIYEETMAEYQMYPRIIALAELTWTSKEQKNYTHFRERLNRQWIRLDAHHINYYIPSPEGVTSQVAFTESASIDLHTSDLVDKIVYTTDGSVPHASSNVYTKPLIITQNTIIQIASVVKHGKISKPRTITLQKETFKPALQIGNTKQGLQCRTSYGYYLTVATLENAKEWITSRVDSMAQANTTLSWGNLIDTKNFKAVELTGYIEILEDGVYYFSSDQDQVWISDQLLINNDGEVKRFSKHDGSIALAKGKHSLKIIYLNNIIGGWPSDWNTINVNYRNSKDPNFKAITPSMCSY